MNILNLIGRSNPLFERDIQQFDDELNKKISKSTFLILGGAGSIGQAVVKEIFKRKPRIIHVVDLSENNLTELVRDLRSSIGYIHGEFKTFALDIGSQIFDVFMSDGKGYDYVLNFTAIKHVRSEKDPYTLLRMIETNVFNTDKTISQAIGNNCKKYFCVSTDKAANPVNLMGGTKRIMEKVLMNRSHEIPISTARFANVAFSDGSLLHSFNQRILKKQPIVAPKDVRRYFVTPKESGQLCMFAALFGENKDIYFPKLSERLHLMTFSDIAVSFLENLNYTPYICETEEEARSKINELINKNQWPCLFIDSDTTGEKSFEEFYTKEEEIDLNIYDGIGIIKNRNSNFDQVDIKRLRERYATWIENGKLSKEEITNEIIYYLPEISYEDLGKYLDEKM